MFPKKAADFKGGYVKALEGITTGAGSMPSGAIYKILSTGIIYRFESVPCPCCGVQFYYTSKGTREAKLSGLLWLGYNLPAA